MHIPDEVRLAKNAKIAAALTGRKRPGLTRRSEKWDRYGDLVKDLVAVNTPMAEICQQTSLSVAVVYKWIAREGWTYKPSGEKLNTATTRATGLVLKMVDRDLATGKVDIAAIAQQCSISTNSVRRIIKQHRDQEMESLRAFVPVSKVCAGCNEDKPLSEFPERADRVGKLYSLCYVCRLDWSHRYRHDNPVPIREASRRRRARLKGSRVDGHKEADIIERDDGKCWFCGQTVDLSLRYPDSLSLAVHHVHPVAKWGPDIAKNVATSHLSCNQAAKDRYDPPFRSWTVGPIPSRLARETVVANHYLHRSPNISFAYGAFDDDQNLMAVMTLGSPTSMRISRSASSDPTRVIEFNRLWIDDAAPYGVGSWFISRVLKQLPPYIVVSYADLAAVDPRYRSLQDGGIYRACSFNYAGTSRPNVEWRLPGKSRNVGKNFPGSEQVAVTPKRRFWTVTGTKSEKRNLRTICKWSALPYEKAPVIRRPV